MKLQREFKTSVPGRWKRRKKSNATHHPCSCAPPHSYFRMQKGRKMASKWTKAKTREEITLDPVGLAFVQQCRIIVYPYLHPMTTGYFLMSNLKLLECFSSFPTYLPSLACWRLPWFCFCHTVFRYPFPQAGDLFNPKLAFLPVSTLLPLSSQKPLVTSGHIPLQLCLVKIPLHMVTCAHRPETYHTRIWSTSEEVQCRKCKFT